MASQWSRAEAGKFLKLEYHARWFADHFRCLSSRGLRLRAAGSRGSLLCAESLHQTGWSVGCVRQMNVRQVFQPDDALQVRHSGQIGKSALRQFNPR